LAQAIAVSDYRRCLDTAMATHIRKRDLYNPTPRESAHDINRIRRQIRAQQSLQIERTRHILHQHPFCSPAESRRKRF
jgi:hypothetical protein